MSLLNYLPFIMLVETALSLKIILYIFFILYHQILLLHLSFCSLIHRNTRPEPAIRCSVVNGPRILQNHDHKTEARLRIDPKVLVFVETVYSKLAKDIAELLVHNRIKYNIYFYDGFLNLFILFFLDIKLKLPVKAYQC